MQEQSLVDRAARIIDQFAFRDNLRHPMIVRQRIARNKAAMILADKAADREDLLNELADAHRQIDELLEVITGKQNFEATSSRLWNGINRRTALLARNGRLL